MIWVLVGLGIVALVWAWHEPKPKPRRATDAEIAEEQRNADYEARMRDYAGRD